MICVNPFAVAASNSLLAGNEISNTRSRNELAALAAGQIALVWPGGEAASAAIVVPVNQGV